MRVYSDIDEVKERVIVTFSRDLTLQDVQEMASTSSKARVLHFPMLIDARATPRGFGPGDARGFQRLLKMLAQHSRLGDAAVLVADEKGLRTVAYLARLASGLCEIRGFLKREAAEQWLGWREPATARA